MNKWSQPLAAVLIALVLLGATFALLPGASASRTPVMNEILPTPREGTASVSTGDAIYILGGFDGNRLRDILRYDPTSGTLEKQNAQLPTGRSMAAAIWDGAHIYLFGGWTTNGFSDAILRYDPQNDTLEAMDATLPTARSHLSAAYDGTHAYLIGGWTNNGYTDQIVRYDPTTDTLQVTATKLPQPRIATSSTATDSQIIIIGGLSSGAHRHDDILHYEPGSDTLVPSQATLPTGRSHGSLTNVAGTLYFFGGLSCDTGPCDTILRYHPNAEELETPATRLESPRQLTSAAQHDGHIYIIGGTGDHRYDEILRFGPSGTPPPSTDGPTLESISDQLTLVGQSLHVNVKATHPTGKTITLTAPEKPPGADFTDHGDGTGTLQWTPTSDQEGTHPVMIRASDGDKEDTESFQITVDPSDDPFIQPISDRTLEIGSTITISISASDPKDRTIDLTLTPLPEHASFTDHGGGEGTLQWDIQADQLGEHGLTVTATAGDDRVEETFTITVIEKIHPPELLPIDPLTLPIGTPTKIQIQATHPEDEPIAITLDGLPGEAQLVDHGNGTATLTWTPTKTHKGEHEATIQATTHGKSDSQSVTFTVVPLYDLEIQSLLSVHNTMAPGTTLEIPVRVTNTGYQQLMVYTQGRTHQTQQPGWSVTTPAAFPLAPGNETTILMKATAPADATGTMARIDVHGRNDHGDTIHRLTNWVIDVPVHIDIQLDNDHHTLTSAATQGIQGTITLTWADGSPATGILMEIAHHMDLESSIIQTDTLARTHTAESDTQGRYRFSLEMEDPTALLPGDHTIQTTAMRGDRTDSTATTYTIS